MKRKRHNYDIDDPRSYNQRGNNNNNRGYNNNKRYRHHNHRNYYNNNNNRHHHQHQHRNHYRGNNNNNNHNNNNNNNNIGVDDDISTIDREQERMSRIRQLLVRIGERSSSTLSHNLDQLSNALLVDIEHYRSFIISTLFECIVHLPIKIPIYATLVGLINHSKQDFGKEIVKTLSNEIILLLFDVNNNDNNNNENKDDDNNNNNNNNNKNELKSIIADTSNQRNLISKPTIDFNRIRLLFRFVSCLYNTNIIPLIDILKMLNFLIKNGIDFENKHNQNFIIKEQFCYIIISSLIWCLNGDLFVDKKQNKEIEDSLNDIIQKINNYIENREYIKNPNALKSFKNIEIDFLSDVWTAFKTVYNDNDNINNNNGNNDNNDEENKKEDNNNVIIIKSIYTPYKDFSRLKKKYNHSLESIENYNNLKWKKIDSDNILPIWLEFGIGKLLDRNLIDKDKEKEKEKDKDKDKDLNVMDKYIIMDYIHDIIEYFNQDTKLCCEQLINLPSSFESKYIIVEGIICKMLLLPSCQSSHHFIFFGKIIIELFRKQTKIWPRVVGPIINKMFHEINNIDIECRDRLIEWFSFHLANFNFQWPWENWSNVCNLFPISSPKTSFIQSIMIKCLHLSYYERFKKTLPNDIINKILPNKPDGNYDKKYQINDIASNLLRLLNQRQSAEDILNHLEKHIICTNEDKDLYKNDKDDEVNEVNESQIIIYKQIELLFICILHVGKSSCSHVLSFLKMYGKKPLKLLLNNTPNNYGQLLLIKILFKYWINSPIRIEILSDKLHAMNYIQPQTIIKFVFNNSNLYYLYKQIYWIMIKQSIDRIVKTTQGMKRGIDKFKNDIKQLNKNLNSDFNDQEMTTINKQNKLKQLNQLEIRLKQTKQKISNIFLLFFKMAINCLNILIDKINKNEFIIIDDNDNDKDEVDDDLLMSEQFIKEQEKIDKEKENAAILKSRQSNVNKYIFDIITSRMIEICRRFYKNIDIETWNKLQNEIFVNHTNNDNNNINDDQYKQKLNDTIQNILEIRQLFAVI